MLKSKKIIRISVLVICLSFVLNIFLFAVPGSSVKAADASVAKIMDMEELNIGSVNGQSGWIATANAEANYSVKYGGIRSIRLVDTSATTQTYGIKSITAMESGTVKWYSRAAQTNGLIAFRGINSSNKVFGVGFGSSGKFVKELPNGSFEDISTDNYTANTWYLFSVTFDCKANTYDIKIVKADLTGVVVSSYDNNTETSNNQYIDKIQLLTSVIGTGTGYFDNISFYSHSRMLMDEGFEGYTIGSLNGKGKWSTAGSSVVVEANGAFSGTNRAKITGSDAGEVSASKSINTYNSITSEVWVNAAQTNKELYIIGKTGSNESFKIGFGNDGKFFYYNGAVKTDTSISYYINTWYRIRVNTYSYKLGNLYKMEVIGQNGTSIYRSGLINMCQTTPDTASYIDTIQIKTPVGSGSTFYFDEWSIMDHDVWYNQTFEGMSVGDINGIEGWTGTAAFSTIVNSGAYEGGNCLKIDDTSSSSATIASVLFPDIKSGTCEYWVKASQTNQILYMDILQGSSLTVRVALATNGHFYSYNGQTPADTGISYVAGEWYRCVIAFDCNLDKYDWYVYDKAGVQIAKVNDNSFYSNTETVKQFRVDTNPTYTGTFYMDDLKLLNSGGFYGESAFNELNLMGRNGDWYKDYDNEKSLLTWGETYVLESYLNMYDAYSSTAYLDKFVDHVDVFLNTRDSIRGVSDYKGASENAWRTGDRYTRAESVRKDINGQDTLKIKSVRKGDQSGGTVIANDNNSICINISSGTNTGTFKLNVHSHTIGYEYTFDNLNMDPASPDYALTRVNGKNNIVALWDMNSSSPVSQRNPVNTVQEENLIPTYMYLLVDNGFIASQLARYVDIVYNTPALKNNPSYKSKADTYKAAVMDIIELFEPYWVDKGTEGYYTLEYGSPIWSDGADEPLNRILALGIAYLYMYKAEGNIAFRDRIEHMANLYKNDLVYDAATDSYSWTYWDKDYYGYGGWALGSGISTNTKSFSGFKTVEDYSHARIDLVFAYLAYKEGIVFNLTDMNRFANTFLNRMLKSDGLTWSTCVDGSGTVETALGVSSWLILTEFNNDVYYRYYDLVNMADSGINMSYLTVSGFLNWAKNKLQ